MVRSAQGPDSNHVQRQLLSTMGGPTQFSLKVLSDIGEVKYGTLFSEHKEAHNVTLIGVAKSVLCDHLMLNAPTNHRGDPGTII